MEQDDTTEQNDAMPQGDAAEQGEATEQDDATVQGDAANQDDAAKKKRNKTILIGAIIVLLIAVIAALLIFGMRACSNRTPTTGQVSGPSSGLSAEDALSLENRIHMAIHGKSLPNGGLLCSYVYIVEASKDASGVAATIDLTTASKANRAVAAACDSAVMAALPEITRVSVVDVNGSVVDAATRK